MNGTSIEIYNVGRIDLWRNTIYGPNQSTSVGSSYDENLRIFYVSLTDYNIENKLISLNGFAAPNATGYDVAINIVNGSSFLQGTDFTVINSGSIISWDGYALDGLLQRDDIVRVMYSENATILDGGESIRLFNILDPNSTIDSNFIGVSDGSPLSDLSYAIYTSSPIKIRYNNFNRVTTPYYGVTGIEDIGNTGVNPQFIDPDNLSSPDFHLDISMTGVEINGGDPIRWHNVFSEMSISLINDAYTGIGTTGILRTNVTPFERDLDRDSINRLPNYEMIIGNTFEATTANLQGNYIGDKGAYEYSGDTQNTGDYYVNENGYDKSYIGTEAYPFSTLDEAFLNASSNNIFVNTNTISGLTGMYSYRYGRYNSNNLELSSNTLQIGIQSQNDIAYIYPNYIGINETGLTYISPDGSDVSGDGLENNPYRTISRALEDVNNSIIVNPGIYPVFQGLDNKRLIGIPKTYQIPLDWELYSKVLEKDWGISGISPNFTSNFISFTGISYIDSNFTFNGDIKYKANLILSSGSITTELSSTSTDKVSVKFEKSGDYLNITYTFTMGGSSYPFVNSITGVNYNKSIPYSITISDGKMICNSKSGSTFNRTKTVSYTNVGDWSANFNVDSVALVKNIQISADSFVGADIYDEAYMRWKMFGILGSSYIPGT